MKSSDIPFTRTKEQQQNKKHKYNIKNIWKRLNIIN